MSSVRRAVRGIKRLLHIIRDYPQMGQRVWHLNAEVEHLRAQLDLLKSSIEVSPAERAALHAQRAKRVRRTRPVVSVCIATYNRAPILVERSLASILNQTYDNLEINVVGDGCTDDTERRVRQLNDSRIRFVNLPARGDYPADPVRRWMVAGTAALNHALSMCQGDFVTHLDDDDEHSPERTEKLLLFSLSNDCDFVWHPFHFEGANGHWGVNEAQSLVLGSVTTSAIFYRAWLKTVTWNVDAHWLLEPGDWNRIRRMKYLDPCCRRYPEVLLSHYRERSQATEAARAAA
jgi:glycosyltransferase involved in cell wall biosynthesis